MSLISILSPLSPFSLYCVEGFVYIFLRRSHMHRGISLEILQPRLARSTMRGKVSSVLSLLLSSFGINYHSRISLFPPLFSKDVLSIYRVFYSYRSPNLLFPSIFFLLFDLSFSLFPPPFCRKLLITRSTETADLI